MAKRQGSELNHLNWDRDEEKEEPGTFTPVSDSELKNRVIRRAKRSLSGNSNNSESESKAFSPFSAFSGFDRSSTQQRSFIFKPQDAQNTQSSVGIKPPDKVPRNGCKESDDQQKSEPAKQSFSIAKPSMTDEPKSKQSDSKDMEYFRQLQNLNESVLKWMGLHIEKNPCCDFTPVFDDYKNHLRKLERLYPVVKKKEAKTFDSAGSSTFKLPKTSTDMLIDKKSNFQSGISASEKFPPESDPEKPSVVTSEMLYGAHFASNTTNTSTFSFGIKQSPTSMTSGSKSGPTSSHSANESEDDNSEDKSTSGFTFGTKSSSDDLTSSTPDSSARPFRFALSAVTSSAEAEQNGKSEEVEEYVPPKNEFTAVQEEDSLYSKRCKLFFKKDKEYVDKGVGTLYLKPLDGKTQLLIRADTNLGNILLNIMLSKSLPIERTGKNNVIIVCVPNPPFDSKDPQQSIPLLIRVKTSDDADELFSKLNEYKS